jgi:hypothetical protein
MAEVFGIVAGSVSIATLFSTCVDCFGYVQLAREFEGDFRTFLLQLSCARLRLTRWGHSIRVLEDPAFIRHTTPEELWTTKKLLLQVLTLFEKVERKSAKYGQAAKHSTISTDGLDDPRSRIEEKMREIAYERVERRKQPGLVKKASWALHDAKHMTSLIRNITDLIENLELIVHHSQKQQFAASQRALLNFEVSRFGQEHGLRDAAEAFQKIDPKLFDRAKTEAARWGHQYAQVSLAGTSVGLFGDSTSDAWRGKTLASFHSFEFLNLTEASKAQFGNCHGGNGVFG